MFFDWRIFRDGLFLACAFLRKSLLFAKLWHHRTTGHARPRIWAYKLFGEPLLFHCLRHLDADFWRAPISFARVQKPMPANSIIIERAWNATLLLPYHRYWERSSADTRFLSSSTLSARWEPLSLSIEWLICMPSSICTRAFNHFMSSLIKLRASSSGEKALFFSLQILSDLAEIWYAS